MLHKIAAYDRAGGYTSDGYTNTAVALRVTCRLDHGVAAGHVKLARKLDLLPDVAEAFAAGVPVVAMAVGGVPEIIENGQTGLLVEPASAAALAEAMHQVVCSTTLCGQLAAQARRHVENNYSPTRQRSLLEMLYQTLLGDAFAGEAEERVHVVA